MLGVQLRSKIQHRVCQALAGALPSENSKWTAGHQSLVGVARHTAHMLWECRDSPDSEQRMLASGELLWKDFVS